MSLNDPNWGRGSGSDGDDDSSRPRRPQGGDQGPPDLDELWRDFNRKLNGMFGKRGGGDSGGPGGFSGGPSMRGAGIGGGVIALVALLLWLGSGFYIVQEGQAAAVLRFGEFKYVTDQAGFKWRMPYPIESHETVDMLRLRQVEIGYRNAVRNKVPRESLMLTDDQSIVDVQFAMQYRVVDAAAYLFNNDLGAQPENIVRGAAETAIREVVGRKKIDQVLYEEKEQVAAEARVLMQAILDRYRVGISIVDVTVQQAQPPEQVQAAFEDANKAAQDRERLINEGVAYANDVIPRARGTAARLLEEAQGYRQRVIATAEGDGSRFSQILKEYERAPEVTRDRMYIEAMQDVFANVSKIYMDTEAGNSLLYLPLDKLLERSAGGASGGSSVSQSGASSALPSESRAQSAPVSRDPLLTRDRPMR